MTRSKYIFCLCFIALMLFVNVNTMSSPAVRNLYVRHFRRPHQQMYNVSLAYSLYFYHIFPVYLKPIVKYCEQNIDYVFPLAKGPFYPDKAKINIKNYRNKDFYVYPASTDMGPVFLLYLTSLLHGQFFPIGVRMLNILIFLSILLFLFHSFHRQKMTLIGLLVCLLFAVHSNFIATLYYYAFTGWGYPLLGSLLIFAIFLPIIMNLPMPEKKLWLRIISAGMVFFIFLTIRSSIIFISLSLIFFVLVYGSVPKYKRIIRAGVTLLILLTPYFIYNSSITYLRQYYHSKYRLPDTQENYHGAHHTVWHGVYCGLGDFGEDKGFKWLDANAQEYVKSVNPESTGLEAEYEIILRKKVLSTIRKNPFWYMRILLLRTKRIFWDRDSIVYGIFQYWVATKYLWIHWVFRISLILFILSSVLFKKYKELKMYLFFIPTIFTGLFITTAAGMLHYFGVLVLYYMPLVFIISSIFQIITKLKVKYGSS